MIDCSVVYRRASSSRCSTIAKLTARNGILHRHRHTLTAHSTHHGVVITILISLRQWLKYSNNNKSNNANEKWQLKVVVFEPKARNTVAHSLTHRSLCVLRKQKKTEIMKSYGDVINTRHGYGDDGGGNGWWGFLSHARVRLLARLPQPEQHSTLIFITNTIWHDSKIQAAQQHLWIRFWLGLSFVCPYIFAAQLVLFDSYCFFSLLFLHRHRAKERERDFGMIQTNTHNYPILVLQKSVCCAIEWVFLLGSSLYGCWCCFFLWLLPSLNTKCER